MSGFRLPRLPRQVAIVDPKTGLPTIDFQRWWQSVVKIVETHEATQGGILDEISDILGLTSDLEAAVDVAQEAAEDAQNAADDAAASAEGASSVASLTNSGVTGTNILTATDAGTDATITVAAHTRVYGDGSTVSITGPTDITGLAYSTAYFVYYDDPNRADTTPSYQTTTSEVTAAQTGDRHLVGMITTPAAAAPDTDGDSVRAPGIGGINP